ncbi:MAG: type II secretion system F family protein [Candidatus Aenigmarchaeota archaeon]|nr:type II secretion system F family protein [Candidatus Aenigmarchaeota archaeon]
MIDKKYIPFIITGVFSGVMLIIFNVFYLTNLFKLAGNEVVPLLINIVGVMLITLPVFMIVYIEHSKIKETEDIFPMFLKDLVEGLRGGMSLPIALKNIKDNDYKSLSPLVKKLYAQISWGIPLEDAMINFAKNTKSKLIARIVYSIIESSRFGGNIATIIDSLSKTSLEIERLRAERRLYLNSQLVTGYIIFFVFIGVLIGLQRFLVPSLAEQSTKLVPDTGIVVGVSFYNRIFRDLLIIEGFFSGLMVGKMTEGSLINGIKHSFIMVVLGLLIFTVAI